MSTSSRLTGIGEYYFSQKLREIEELNKQGKDIINLGIGNPDLPPHPDVIKVLQEESMKPNVHGYQTYKGSPLLREAISQWYQKWYDVKLDPASEILPLMGSKEGILHICMTYLNSGDKALIPNPGYPTYEAAVKLAGGTCIAYSLVEENNYYPDLVDLENHELSNVKLMFVNYPHMPTGQPASMECFERIVSFAKEKNILIVHDNPYSFILPRWLSGDHPISMLSVPGAKDCVIELNSVSKSHNMAGWRVGMLCGAAHHVNDVLRFKSNLDSGMFLPIQLAAAKALTLGMEWHEEVNAIYHNRREKIFQLLDLLGCIFSKKQSGLFVWAGIPAHMRDGYALSDELLYRSNVFITPGGIFGSEGNKYIRVSICNSIGKIEEAINRILVRGERLVASG